MIVDDLPHCWPAGGGAENVLPIAPFYGDDPYDTELLKLLPLLGALAHVGGDVRSILGRRAVSPAPARAPPPLS